MKPVCSARLMSRNVVFESLEVMPLRVARDSSGVVVALTMECASLRHRPLATAPRNAVAEYELIARSKVTSALPRFVGWLMDV